MENKKPCEDVCGYGDTLSCSMIRSMLYSEFVELFPIDRPMDPKYMRLLVARDLFIFKKELLSDNPDNLIVLGIGFDKKFLMSSNVFGIDREPVVQKIEKEIDFNCELSSCDLNDIEKLKKIIPKDRRTWIAEDLFGHLQIEKHNDIIKLIISRGDDAFITLYRSEASLNARGYFKGLNYFLKDVKLNFGKYIKKIFYFNGFTFSETITDDWYCCIIYLF